MLISALITDALNTSDTFGLTRWLNVWALSRGINIKSIIRPLPPHATCKIAAAISAPFTVYTFFRSATYSKYANPCHYLPEAVDWLPSGSGSWILEGWLSRSHQKAAATLSERQQCSGSRQSETDRDRQRQTAADSHRGTGRNTDTKTKCIYHEVEYASLSGMPTASMWPGPGCSLCLTGLW